MDNFKTITGVESVKMLSTFAFEPRSIVVYNEKKGVAYNIFARVRNSDALSICKALAKIILGEKFVSMTMHNNPDVIESGKSKGSIVGTALAGHYLFATDRLGNVLMGDKMLYTGEEENLRKQFSFTKKMAVYQSVIVEALPWDNERVSRDLEVYARATIALWNYRKAVDGAIEEAANSNYEEARKTILEAREEQRKTYLPATMLQLEAAVAKKKATAKKTAETRRKNKAKKQVECA
jgi:hypothetical protein